MAANYAYRINITTNCPAQWIPSHPYALGRQVNNGANTYVCTTAGTSASSGGPTGTGTGITDGTCVWAFVVAAVATGETIQALIQMPPAQWQVNHTYSVNDNVLGLDNHNVYRCTTGGASAASGGGPTGTGTGIVDNVARWSFQNSFSATQAPTGVSCTVTGIFLNGVFGGSLLVRRYSYLAGQNGLTQATNGNTENLKAYRIQQSSVKSQAIVDSSSAFTFIAPTSGGIALEAPIYVGGDSRPGQNLLKISPVIGPGETFAIYTYGNFNGAEALDLEIPTTEA
jgi:hypothetical protein